MNTKKSLFVGSLLSAALVGVSANYMNVILNDGSTTSFLVDDINEVVFYDEIAPDSSDFYEYVDLGLSVLWATRNVGADEDYEMGPKFAWSETYSKETFDMFNHKYIIAEDNLNYKYTKYTITAKQSASGEPDNITVLQPEDDAATVNWGKYWRTPSMNELNELIGNCSWTWSDDYKGTGSKGFIVTSKVAGFTDKSIFLPAETVCTSKCFERGYYWSNELHSNGGSGWFIDFNNFDGNATPRTGSNVRYTGNSVRPVRDKSTVDMTFTVNFFDAEKNLISTQKVKAGNAAEDVAIEAKDGYNFIGWSENIDKIDRNLDVYPLMYKASGTVEDYEYVDLGLSVLWASKNIGAETIGSLGSHIAWGETIATESGDWKSYSYPRLEGTNYGMSVTNKDTDTKLFPEDDAASVIWNAEWRIPTKKEMTELVSKCDWKWLNSVNDSEVGGFLVTSKVPGYEDKFIFLPAAGRMSEGKLGEEGTNGVYWTSEVDSTTAVYSWLLYFNQGETSISRNFRDNGFSIRPVTNKAE